MASVAALLDRVREEWSELQMTLAAFDEAQLTRPGHERWSVKDHIAYLAVSEGTVAATLRGDPPHAQFGIDPDAYRSIAGDELRINEFFYQRWHNRSLADVRAASDRVHADAVAALERLTDADLDKRLRDFERAGETYGSEPRRQRT